jgi:hypothetical protein
LSKEVGMRSQSLRVFGILFVLASTLVTTANAQPAPGYPVRPTPLPQAEEVALARSAAPPEVADHAAVYVLSAKGPVKVEDGTNGVACMVSRDLHEGSLYPICFDREAVRTSMQRELMELRLRAEGKSEEDVQSAVKRAFASGELKAPATPSVIYMMSPRQVLFSSPQREGRRVGAWHPHLMIAMPNVKAADVGLASPSSIPFISLDNEGTPSAQLIVHVPTWSNGVAVK